jgi:hypothetical protein
MIGSIEPWRVLAQQAIDCSVNGFCVSNSIQNLLGLPQGTLNVVTYHPWDRVVKRPEAAAWIPIEAEARAAMAALHGVANDRRLPHAALDDLRAFMFMRLVSIAKKKADGLTLTPVEQDALDTFSELLVVRRSRAAQLALDEYARWDTDKCHYTVPSGFGFEPYDPGPDCMVGGVVLVPPRPPTEEQFTAYGAALAMTEADEATKTAARLALGIPATDPFVYDPALDAQAAIQNADDALAIAAGVAGAVLAGTAAAIAATLSITVASTFAAMSGSFAILGTTASTVAAGATISAGTVGVGVAASLPALIIVSVVVAVVATIQFAEDQSILPALQESLEESQRAPDIWALASSDEPLNKVELFATFIYQTLPSFDEQRLEGVMPPPSQRQPGDPRFEVNGVAEDVLVSRAPDGRTQETFMSQTWFVTRTLTNQVWGPWRWSLYLHYISFVNNQLTHHTAGIQPTGFFALQQLKDANGDLSATPLAAKTTELQVFSGTANRTVKWMGNKAPVLAPTVSEQPTTNVPVTFQANASDSDGAIQAIKWFIQDPAFGITTLYPDLAECSFTPPGRQINGLQAECPWKPFDGPTVTHTYTQAGTYGVLVMARDTEGAITQEQFNVVLAPTAPTLTITDAPVSGPESQAVTVSGTVQFPAAFPGLYTAATKLVIEWGDGAVAEQWYPCEPQLCSLGFGPNGGLFFSAPAAVGDAPWQFTFSHDYVHRADRPLPPTTTIKVYAITNQGGRAPTQRFDVSIGNVAPVLSLRSVCSGGFALPCFADFDRRDVAFGQQLKIRGRIIDHPDATHFVHVLWGDETSTASSADCDDGPSCPGFGEPWPNTVAGKDMDLVHTYANPGIYPIMIVVDDRGPNGKTTTTTQAVIFGIKSLTGAAQAEGGTAETYSYDLVVPTGAPAPAVTPACAGGTATPLTASTFSCVFDNVTAATDRQVSLSAVIAGTPFEKSLTVSVRPGLPVITMNGPLEVTEGTTVQFTYSVANLPGPVNYTHFCGPNADFVSAVDGASFTCRFNAVGAETASAVFVQIAGSGVTGERRFDLTIEQDLVGPALTLPATIEVDSTSNAGAIVTFTASALDAISGNASITCTPASGSSFPVGQTSVACSAADWQNNGNSGTFAVIVRDVSPPTLTLPNPITVDATGPSGALVTFSATATDAIPANPTVTCTPSSASTFPIGTTPVNCSATDAAGNPKTGSFTVTVRGPSTQIAALEAYVQSLNTSKGTKNALLSAISDAIKAITSGKTKPACDKLSEIVSIARSARGRTLTLEEADRIIADVQRMQAILGC